MSLLPFFFLLSGVLAYVDGASISEGRIVGGEVTEVTNFPWQVSLRLNYGRHLCGGSLIAANKVLTAAHCVNSQSAEEISVVTGSSSLARGGEFHAVSHIVYHADYISGSVYSWQNDIALITLATSAASSSTQSPIPISTTRVPGNTSAVTSGWGRAVYPGFSLPTNLQTFNLTILSNEDCQTYHTTRILDSHICAFAQYGQGVCNGDSGGPLVADGTVVGITSWARLCAVGVPDVWTRVSSFVDWIEEHLTDA